MRYIDVCAALKEINESLVTTEDIDENYVDIDV